MGEEEMLLRRSISAAEAREKEDGGHEAAQLLGEARLRKLVHVRVNWS